MAEREPGRRWPIWPFIPAVIMVVAIPLTVWIDDMAGLGVRAFLYSWGGRLWQIATVVFGTSLVALLYGFVRSLLGEISDRRWRLRPFIAAAFMVFAIPSIAWTAYAIEFLARDAMTGKALGALDVIKAIAGGSLLAIIYGFPHALLVATAIVGGNCCLIHKRLDTIWASTFLGAGLGLIVLGMPPIDPGLWPYLMIAGGGASALFWRIVVHPLRIARRKDLGASPPDHGRNTIPSP
jgi:hypothetical protein